MSVGTVAPVSSVHLLRSVAELAALDSEWDDLLAACPGASPFQSHGWTTGWARVHVPEGGLRVVVVREAGRLAAAVPLHRTRRGPWPVLTVLGGAITDVTDVLARPGFDRWDSIGDALLADPGWRAIDLPEAPVDGGAARWADDWAGRVSTVPGSCSLHIPVDDGGLAGVLDRIPRRTARTLRRKLATIDQLDVVRSEAVPGEVPEFLDRLLALHAEQWAGRGGNPEHLSPPFRAHLALALPGMIERGQAVCSQWRVGGDLLAAQIDLVGEDRVASWLCGVSPRLRTMVDSSVLLTRHDIELAGRRGVGCYDMLRGQEDYKFRWRPVATTSARRVLHRPGVLGAAGLGLAVAGRVRAIAVAKERAPWLRDVRDRLSR